MMSGSGAVTGNGGETHQQAGKEIKALVSAIGAGGGKPVLVLPEVGGATLADGSKRKADGQLAGTPSQLFNALAIDLFEDGCAALSSEMAAVQFAMGAFDALMAVGANAFAQPLLEKPGVEPNDGVTGLGDDFIAAAKQRFYAREPNVRTLA